MPLLPCSWVRARQCPIPFVHLGWCWAMPPHPMLLDQGQIMLPSCPAGLGCSQAKFPSPVWLDWGWAICCPLPWGQMGPCCTPFQALDQDHRPAPAPGQTGHCPSSLLGKKIVHHCTTPLLACSQRTVLLCLLHTTTPSVENPGDYESSSFQ